MGQPRFQMKDFQKVMHSCQFRRPKRHYAKMLNDIIAFCGVKYFRTVAHAQAASLSKKKTGFSSIKSIFYLKKYPYSNKSNHIFWK